MTSNNNLSTRTLTYDILSNAGSDVDTGDVHGAVPEPSLVHSLKHNRSILSIAVSSTAVFAGTEAGDILVFSLDTYQRLATIDGHKGSVLGLSLSEEKGLLFSCASDRFVNVWDIRTLQQVHSIYSHKDHDIGDIYSVAFAVSTNTIYLGTQNASILWYDLDEKDDDPSPSLTSHPYQRQDRFFDSAGPGGIRTPRPEYHEEFLQSHIGIESLQIAKENIQPFAHYGYIYCMTLLRGIYGNCESQQFLVTGGGDGIIKIWSLDKSESGVPTEIAQLGDASGDSVLSLVLDGSLLISGTIGGRVKVWDLETRQLLRDLKANVDDVLALSVGEGCLFVSGSNGRVETYNRQFERLQRYTAHQARILASAFTIHNKEALYFTGANDNSVNMWNVKESIAGQTSQISATSNEQLLDRLRVFISHKTVSSDERCRTDCRRGASFLRSLFRELGAVAEMLPLEDPSWNPIVLATFRANAHRTTKTRTLFYAHYDVVRAEGKWETDPFRMEGINEHLYGRGITDNKGPLLASIYAVADLLAAKALEADVVFLVEGEEECGSRGFAQAVQKYKQKIGRIDWILLANSYWLDDEVPCLTYGLRGVIHATIEVSSKNPDLHSGVDGNSRGDESMKDLIAVLNSVVGRRGHVKIPGFYKSAPEMTDEEAEHYKRVSSSLTSRNPSLGPKELVIKQLQQKWREPSLTVHGIDTSGPFNSTIIPRLAKASISLRLVPHQEAKKVAEDLVSFLQEEFDDLESSNRLRVTVDHKADPWLGDIHNALYKTLEQGIIQAWPEKFASKHSRNGSANVFTNGATKGTSLTKPLYIREGGSIPAIRFLEKEFAAAAAHLPCGQASDNAHLDNERLRLINLYRSRDVFKFVFRELPKEHS